MFEHLPLHLEARNGKIKEMAFFEGEAKYSEQVQIGAINCAPPFTDQREDFKGRFTRYDFVACDNGLRQAHDMIYDCCVRQKKCRSILKHALKRCDNRKSCRKPVVSLSHATKSYRVNRP